jgi:hypothetical protein
MKKRAIRSARVIRAHTSKAHAIVFVGAFRDLRLSVTTTNAIVKPNVAAPKTVASHVTIMSCSTFE